MGCTGCFTQQVTVHEIVGSYALQAGLDVDETLLTADFYHRLVSAGAFRWGPIIKLTVDAIAAASAENTGVLSRDHFIDAWVAKTQANRAATPFTHSGFETMYRKDHPFVEALTG